MGKCFYLRKGDVHTVPSNTLPGSDIAVGSSVFLMENGSPVEYLIVNKGIPGESSLYDNSCDGIWLLRKDIIGTHVLHSTNREYQYYYNSDLHAYLNADILGLFDEKVQSAIKEVKIPYTSKISNTYGGHTVSSGANGLSAKVFLLSCLEMNTGESTPVDGVCLEYFTGADNSKRIAYLNGAATIWWTRTVKNDVTFTVATSGSGNSYTVNDAKNYGVRPAIVLPHSAQFDKSTLLFKGV